MMDRLSEAATAAGAFNNEFAERGRSTPTARPAAITAGKPAK